MVDISELSDRGALAVGPASFHDGDRGVCAASRREEALDECGEGADSHEDDEGVVAS